MIARLKRLIHRPVRTLASLDAYERWAATYPPHAHNALMELEESTMLRLLPSLEGSVVLDLACGTGRYALLARERGAQQVIAVDSSAAMLEAAPALPNRVQATTETIPLRSGSVDGVICGLALGHLPQIQPSLREIARLLKPEGWALISDVHPQIAASGAQRTFTAPDGKVYAVEHYVHELSDYRQAAQQAGLTVDTVEEPHLIVSDQPVVLALWLVKE